MLKLIKNHFEKTITALKKVSLPTWGLILSPFLLWLVLEAPRWQASRVTLTDPEKYFEVENKARTTVVQAVGGLFLFMTAFAALRNARAAEDNRKIAEENKELAKQTAEDNRRLTEDKQFSERFTKAVEMLADKERLEVRLGGIYTLERVARDSPQDHWTIMEVLTSFIQEKCPLETEQSEIVTEQDVEGQEEKAGEVVQTVSRDIQALLTVIGRRNASKDPNGTRLRLTKADLSWADLSGADLSGANLSGANLSWAWLHETNLEGALLFEAKLSWADLTKTNLRKANLRKANLCNAKLCEVSLTEANLYSANLKQTYLKEVNLSWANLSWANLPKANLSGAYLNGANLSGAYLDGANLSGANLSGTNLSGANLSGANLSWANLEGANLERANLDGANFRGCKNLDLINIQTAFYWHKVSYDLDFAEKLKLDRDEQILRAKECEWDEIPF